VDASCLLFRLAYEVAEQPLAGRKCFVIDIAIEGLVHSEDQAGHSVLWVDGVRPRNIAAGHARPSRSSAETPEDHRAPPRTARAARVAGRTGGGPFLAPPAGMPFETELFQSERDFLAAGSRSASLTGAILLHMP